MEDFKKSSFSPSNYFYRIQNYLFDTAWKLSVFGVFLDRIFPYLVQMRENTDQKKSENGHFLRSVKLSQTANPNSWSLWEACRTLNPTTEKILVHAKWMPPRFIQVTRFPVSANIFVNASVYTENNKFYYTYLHQSQSYLM